MSEEEDLVEATLAAMALGPNATPEQRAAATMSTLAGKTFPLGDPLYSLRERIGGAWAARMIRHITTPFTRVFYFRDPSGVLTVLHLVGGKPQWLVNSERWEYVLRKTGTLAPPGLIFEPYAPPAEGTAPPHGFCLVDDAIIWHLQLTGIGYDAERNVGMLQLTLAMR
ncbi:unnamed protein product [Chrysoparadoxa australica]